MQSAKEKILEGLSSCEFKFTRPPLVLGGLALEYYGIRETSHDYDYMVSAEDWLCLKRLHPDKINLFGGKTEKDIDATINLEKEKVDLISTLYQHDYDHLSKNAIVEDGYIVISIDNLLFTKTLDAVYNKHDKSKNDQEMIVKHILKVKYPHLEIE